MSRTNGMARALLAALAAPGAVTAESLCLFVAASAATQEAPEAKDPVEALAPPRWFNALGTYGRNVIFWRAPERPDRSLTAVIVERREGEDGRWRAISPAIRDADRWFDNEVRPDRSYSYRASSLGGTRRSEFTPMRSASPRDPMQCSLPVYELTLPEAERNAMLANPRKDVEAEGQLHFQGQPYPVRIRLHGQSTRLAQKKSYRIECLDPGPFTRPVTFLKAEPMDHTLQQEKLSPHQPDLRMGPFRCRALAKCSGDRPNPRQCFWFLIRDPSHEPQTPQPPPIYRHLRLGPGRRAAGRRRQRLPGAPDDRAR